MNRTKSKTRMSWYGVPASTLLAWANEIRIWAGVVAAISAVAAGVAGYAQIRIQSIVGAEKDEALSLFKAQLAERTAKAQAEAAQANEQAVNLSAQAEVARLEQERIRTQNLALSANLERERADRLRLESRLSSRRVTPQQKQAFLEAMGGEGSTSVASVTRLGDREAGVYASDIITALKQAGVTIEVRDIGAVSPPPYGLVVHADRSDPIVRAFAAAGLEFQLLPATGPGLHITVGLKPPAL